MLVKTYIYLFFVSYIIDDVALGASTRKWEEKERKEKFNEGCGGMNIKFIKFIPYSKNNINFERESIGSTSKVLSF